MVEKRFHIVSNQTTIIFALFGVLVKCNQCNPRICLKWKISPQILTLTCKVSNLHYRVMIDNPGGVVVADCLPPSPSSKCEANIKNVNILQNRKTNETIMTLNDDAHYNISGQWTCRHGYNLDMVSVDVWDLHQFIDLNCGNTTQSGNDVMPIISAANCISDTLQYTAISFTVAVLCILTISVFCKGCRPNQHRGYYRFSCIISNGRKRTIFVVITVVLHTLGACIAIPERTNCTTKWIMLVLGFLVILLSGLLLLLPGTECGEISTQKETDQMEEEVSYRLNVHF